MKRTFSPWMILAAVGGAMAASAVLADPPAGPQLINVSGSSLLKGFIGNRASSNDFIGVTAMTPALGTNIIPTTIVDPSAFASTQKWALNYRISGSINGLNELINYGYPSFVTSDDSGGVNHDLAGNGPGGLGFAKTSDAFCNNTQYVTTNFVTGVLALGPAYNSFNPGGEPYRASGNGAARNVTGFGATAPGSSASPSEGVTIDIAYTDVPAVWGIYKPDPMEGAVPSYTRKPLDLEYGGNPRVTVAPDGSSTGPLANFTNKLFSLNGRTLDADPNNAGTRDGNTIYSIPVAMAVVAPITNPGTGITHLKMSEMQHLWTTGRLPTGENFVVSTRNIGSGTRNVFMNTLGVDPSYGVGDNIGGEAHDPNTSILGSDFYPTNKFATNLLLNTVRNNRLAVGYAGADGATTGSSPASWLVNNQMEIIDTQNDIYPGAVSDYVRPTLERILSNDPTATNIEGHGRNGGWLFSGAAVMNSIGDSLAENAQMNQADTTLNYGGVASHSGAPSMVNKAAAQYVNNIYQSELSFGLASRPSLSTASPGEYIADQFILPSASKKIAGVSNPTTRVDNNAANSPLISFSTNAYNFTLTTNPTYGTFGSGTDARMASFNTSIIGLVPSRKVVAGTYSDAALVPGGNQYIEQNGTLLTYAANLDLRNKIALDFDGDGARTLADAKDMIGAWRQRWDAAHPVWAPSDGAAGANACIEILGDANGDGSFDAKDVRYWADGLAIKGGHVDRKAGFKAVDDAFGGASVAPDGTTIPAAPATANFFGTVKATNDSHNCVAWNNGDSRADVAGSGKISPGWAPTGADGRIDGADIDYVYAQMRAVGIAHPWTDGLSADWTNLGQAIKFDLSADINGDLLVNKADVQEILSILGTRMGDVNLDGVVDATDRAIILAHMGQTNVGWAGGDLNGDGVVDAADLALACVADFDGDGHLAVADIFAFLNAWFAGSCSADINGGGLAVSDIFDFLNAWFAGC